ncbi:hypothetical protein Vadar_031495 [Vaccinium darrowii]|uniref:Uncharacterized protein n=1 Tax=Vaccinium darrowii TaxID=229202 RepID=A0ACB7YZY4_9ERIC|nr:hypothetical protein Vadar_031495 [Vaccinium darrowii]
MVDLPSSQMAVQDQDSPIRGDILEAILSHAPLTDVVPATHVSKAWRRAVISSPPLLNRLEPWLLLHHTRNNTTATATTTHAYDSRSHLWIETKLHPPSVDCNSNTTVLRSSHSNLLYTLSPSKLSFSFDPLHLTWHHADGPTVWRANPVVALVGRRLVVAGGGCDFDDDQLAVEAYDIDSRVWTTLESMPAGLKDSASSTWLSTAVFHNRILFVTEKQSGVTHAFDPEINVWCGPYDLRPDPSVFSVTITCFDDRLIAVGLIGEAENVEGVRVWGVKNCASFECELIGEMPSALVEKLRSGSYWVSSVGVCMAGNVLYIYNQATVEEIFTCEFVGNGGGCRWESVRNVRSAMERVVFTSSEVGIGEVHKGLAAETRRFTAELTQVDK